MNDNNSNKSTSGEHIWAHGTSVSSRASSGSTMGDQRKEIIRQSLEFEIIDIRTFTGYKGDLLVEITTMEPDAVRSIKQKAESLGFEIVIHKDIISLYKIFCISPSFNVYDLKDEF